ncbi:MAG: CAP domain-containing protein [Myxococcota bacterium]
MLTLSLNACGGLIETDSPLIGGPDGGPVAPPSGDGSDAPGPVDLGLGSMSPDAGGGLDLGPPALGSCARPFEAEVIAAANLDRSAAGAPALTCADTLALVARAHSQDMCDRTYFSHDNLDGESPFDRMRAAGISYRAAGENIAQGQSSPGQVHQAWMDSSGHRANILNGTFGRIGVGYVECAGENRRHYWTQVFAD